MRTYFSSLLILVLFLSGCAIRRNNGILYVGGSLQQVIVQNDSTCVGELLRNGEHYSEMSVGQNINVSFAGGGSNMILMFKAHAPGPGGEVYIGSTSQNFQQSSYAFQKHEWTITSVGGKCYRQ